MTDIKMPIMDGLDFITEVRKVDVFTPIVLFSAYNEQRYLAKAINLKVEGLILKPIKLDELFAVLARCAKSLVSTNELEVLFSEGVVYNVNTNEVFKNGRPLVLGAKEYALLGLLMSKYPHILTKEETSQKIWALESVSDSAMKNIIARLRAKIGVKHIVAIPGIGWRLEMDAGQGRAG